MTWQIGFVYALTVGAIVLFLIGRVRLDVTAALVIIALAVSGILTPAQAVAGFGNPLIVLFAGLFVISEGLHRTGVAAAAGRRIAQAAGSGEVRVMVLMMLVVALLSAFMSSTGVVALFVPVVLSLAREAGLSPRRLLMPLAISSLIGGMLTLIGTPPNLVVHRALVEAGWSGFSFFDFAPIGGVILVLGILYMTTLGRWLLPVHEPPQPADRRKRLHEMAAQFGIEDNLYRLRVERGSRLVGRTVGEERLRRNFGLVVIAVERQGVLLATLAPVLTGTRLQAGDTLVVSAPPTAVTTHKNELGLEDLGFPHGLQRRFHASFGVAEALVVPGSPLIGKTVYQSNLRERQRLNVLSVRRGEGTLALDFQGSELQTGDVLLLAGAWSDLERLGGPRRDLVLLEVPEEITQRTWHADRAPWAIAITLGMLVLMVSEATTTVVAVMLAAFAMVATRCVEPEEAYQSMNWQSLVLIAGMLPLADALQSTGGADLIVGALVEAFRDLGPYAMLFGLFVLTSLLSQFISNTATTVLIAPIALGIAGDLGYQPMAFMMTVAIAASTAFATPVASPVNMLVLAPGEYRFIDFAKVGMPLQLIALLASMVLVPVVFPLTTG